MPLSTLTIEPHRIQPDTRKEYYGSVNGAIFWRILVDGKEITNRATPFAPESDSIELSGNIQMPFYRAGDDFVTVRYSDSYVLWFMIDTVYDLIERGDFSKANFLYMFDREYYIQTVNQHRASFRHVPVVNQPPVIDFSWSQLESAELQAFLLARLPRPEDALYRTIGNPQDVIGQIFLRRLKRNIQEHGKDLRIVSAPEKYITLSIGLDLPEFTEMILHIGKNETGFVVKFEQQPAFPLWLNSTAFEKAFQGESF